MLLGALVNAAAFGSFTFLAPVVTGTAGLGELWVSVVLMLFGAGFVRRCRAGGPVLRPASRPGRRSRRAAARRLGSLADKPAALLVLVFAQGALSFALGSTLITQVLYKTAGAPTMAGSYATAAVIAAGTLSGGAGELGPLWASGLLVAVALLVALPFRDALTPGWSGVRRRAD